MLREGVRQTYEPYRTTPIPIMGNGTMHHVFKYFDNFTKHYYLHHYFGLHNSMAASYGPDLTARKVQPQAGQKLFTFMQQSENSTDQ